MGGGGSGGGGVGRRGRVGGCQGGCERRIEVFVKIQKKNGGSGGGGVGRVGFGGHKVDVNEELKFLGKVKKIYFFFLGGGVRGVGLGGQDGCERRIENSKKNGGGSGWGGVGLVGGQGGCGRRIEVFVKIQNKNWEGVGSGGGRVGGQGGCERRIEVFGKIHKINFGGGGGGR